MTITVEDGTGVVGANSYVSVATARTYASARGVTLSATDSVVETLIFKAMDYLESMRDSYKGSKTTQTQALQWPRQNVCIDGYAIDITVIPNELKNAEMQLIMDISSGLDPMASGDGSAFIISDKTGPLETKWSESVATSGLPILRRAEALLAPLLAQQGFLTVVRA